MSGTAENKRLFFLPEYDQAQAQFMHEGVRALMEAKDPLFASIRKEEKSTLSTTQNTVASGEIVQAKPIEMESGFILTFDQVVSCDVGVLAEQMDVAAEANLKVVMSNMFEHIGRLSNAAGTSVDASGQEFSHDLYLTMLERIEMRFDENDEPVLPTMVVHPKTAEQIAKIGPRTSEQEQAFKGIIEHKRREFNARKRNRQLS